MRAGAVFLLLLAAICAISATSDDRPSYKEALASSLGQQAAAAVRLNSADSYHGVDHVCFSASQTCGHYYWLRSHLTCCKDEAPYYEKKSATEDILAPENKGPMIGTCHLTITGPCIPLSANLLSHGLYQLHCELHGEAGACGPHDCGDLVLTSQGQALGLDYATVKGERPSPVMPWTVEECVHCYHGPVLKAQGTKLPVCKKADKGMVVPKDDANEPKPVEHPPTPVSKGPKIPVAEDVYIISGPVTISSKTKDSKWKEGWLEYVYAEKIDLKDHQWCEWMEGKNNGKLPFIDSDDFNNYKFQLYKNKGHY